MQNYNNPPPPPQGGYQMPPQPPAKKGMSTGVKVIIVVLILVIGGGGLLVIGAGGLVYYLSGRARETADVRSAEALKGLTGGGAGVEAESPSPTAEQQAAVAGGQSAQWEQQELTWTVPQRWKRDSVSSTSFNWS